MKAYKIIKIYFYFLLIVLTIAGGSYNPSVKNFYVDSAEKIIAYGADIKDIGNMRINMASVLHNDIATQKPIQKSEDVAMSDEIFVELNKFEYKNFVRNGEYGANIMNVLFKSYDKKVEVKKLSLTIFGADESQVIELFLEDEEKTVYTAEKNGNKFTFNLNILLNTNSSKKMYVKANLPNNLIVNQRIRLDIENASDLECLIDGKKLAPKSIYPIVGHYISIVGEKIKKQEKK